MPEGFGYPFNHDAWAPLVLRASYEPLEGAPISVIGRLASGTSLEQANAEVRAFGQRTSEAFPATHEHLRPAVTRLGEATDFLDGAALATRNLPVLLVLMIACMSVGTLVYARTATREGEIAIRAALGAGRARIIGQLFVEALVLASVSAAIGLLAVDRALAWGIESVNRGSGGAPFWMAPGLDLSTVLYAGGLAVVSAVMLSVLPALRVTRARVQPHLANLGTGRATLRFGRLWTGAMIAQVALTAMGIPAAMESASQTTRKVRIRGQFPSREYLSARIDLDRPFDEETTAELQERRTETFEALARRVEQEPGVVAVVFADRVPGAGGTRRFATVEPSRGATPVYDGDVPHIGGDATSSSTCSTDRYSPDVHSTTATRVPRPEPSSSMRRSRARLHATPGLVHRSGPACGTRRRRPWRTRPRLSRGSRSWASCVTSTSTLTTRATSSRPCFTPRLPGAMSPLLMSVRMRGSPAALAARLPVIATTVDARILVPDAQPMAGLDPRYVPDGVPRSGGRGDGSRPVPVGAGHLLARLGERVAADTRDRAACVAWRHAASGPHRHPVPGRGAHGERHRGRKPLCC